MAGRTFDVTFRIDGALSASMRSSMQAAQNAMRDLGRSAQNVSRESSAAMRNLRNEYNIQAQQLSRVQAASAIRDSMNQANPALVRMRLQSARLRQEYLNQERQLESMRSSLTRLRAVNAEYGSSMPQSQQRVMAEQIRAAERELAAQERAVRSAQNAYRTQSSEADRLNARLQAQREALAQLQSQMREAASATSGLSSSEAELQRQLEATDAAMRRQRAIDDGRQARHDAAQEVYTAYGNFQNALNTAGTIMSPFTSAVQTYADFDSVMSEVRAITKAEGAEMDMLTAKARELGATTSFKASEVAKSMTYLGMAGWKPAQIEAGTKAMLDLARAAGMDLPRAADIVSDGLSAFNMSADQATRFTDAMAVASTSANTNVELMGETLKYVGPVAGSLGYTIEDIGAATGFLGNRMIKGSMAGTALRSIMTRMAKPTKESAAAMDRLGLSMTDSQGQMKPFMQIIDDMRKGFAGLTETEKAEYAAMLGGQEAMAGVLALANVTQEEFDDMKNAMANTEGAAARMSDTMGDNLVGSLKQLESAAEAAQISMGKMFEPAVRAAADFATQSVAGLDGFIQRHETAVQWAGVLAGAVAGVTVMTAGAALAMATWGFATTTIKTLKTAVMGLTMVTKAKAAATAVATGAQWALNFAMSANPAGLIAAGIVAVVAAIGLLIAACPGVSAALSAAWNDPQGAVHGFSQLVKSATDDAVQYVMARWETLKQALEHPIEAAINFFDHGDVIGGSIKGGDAIAAQARANRDIDERRRAEDYSSQIQSRGGGLSAIQNTIQEVDTGNFQTQVDAAAQASADAASRIQTLPESVQQVAQTFQDAGQLTPELFQQLSEGVAPTTEQLNQLQASGVVLNGAFLETIAQLQGGNPLIQQHGQASQDAATGVQAHGQASQDAATGVQAHGQASNQAASGADHLGSSAQAAGNALSYLPGAINSAVSQINSAAANVNAKAAATPVAANAEGGIYPKGAFLTTFAEKSPEAAIPLDGSDRAVKLWQQAGQALGQLPGNSAPTTSTIERARARRVQQVLKQAEAAGIRTNQSSQNVSRETLPQTPPIVNTPARQSSKDAIKQLEEAVKYLPGNQGLTSPTFSGQKMQEQTSEQKRAARAQVEYDKLSDRVKNSKSGKALARAMARQSNVSRETSSSILAREMKPYDGNLNQGSISPIAVNHGMKSGDLGGILGGNIGQIFSGGIQLPGQSAGNLNQLPKLGDVDGILGNLTKNVSRETFSPPSKADSLPSINLSITINGNADAKDIQSAGQTLSADLMSQLESWWTNKQRDASRRSFA